VKDLIDQRIGVNLDLSYLCWKTRCVVFVAWVKHKAVSIVVNI